MARALVLVTLLFVIPGAISGQTPSVLHIKVVLPDAEGKATPVPRHALLISDNPATSAPRRVVTAQDGTADCAAGSRQLHRRIGPPDRAAGQGVPVDADRGHRRRPRRRPSS